MALPSVGGGYQFNDGNVNEIKISVQSTPTAKTTSATLTAAELAAGIITVNQGGGAGSTLTLPTGTLMDAAFSNMKTDSSFDFSVINISTVDAEDATIAVGTGWTLVGDVVVNAKSASTIPTSGLFRARKTGTATWTLYRLA